MKSLEFIQEYWKNPDDQNNPLTYRIGEEKTNFLIENVKRHIKVNDNILELGCNVGRNLNGLFQAGYKNLMGIEINYGALQLMRELYPETYQYTEREYGTVKSKLIELDYRKRKFKLIYTMAVLCHIHPDEENLIFDLMASMAKKIIVIEDEVKVSDRHCPRNYQDIFEQRGMQQVEMKNCSGIKGLGKHYVYRLFENENI